MIRKTSKGCLGANGVALEKLRPYNKVTFVKDPTIIPNNQIIAPIGSRQQTDGNNAQINNQSTDSIDFQRTIEIMESSVGQYESFNDQGVKTDNLSCESLSLLDDKIIESTVREAEAPIATQSNSKTIDNQTPHTVGHHVPTQVQAEVTLSEPLTIDSATNACWYLHAQVENSKVPLLFDRVLL